MASNDLDFERKAADIIGLYLNPPQHAAVFCVDEKSAIQALKRLDPVLPMSPAGSNRIVSSTIATARFLVRRPGRAHRKGPRPDRRPTYQRGIRDLPAGGGGAGCVKKTRKRHAV
jgi:hypothetical protein